MEEWIIKIVKINVVSGHLSDIGTTKLTTECIYYDLRSLMYFNQSILKLESRYW